MSFKTSRGLSHVFLTLALSLCVAGSGKPAEPSAPPTGSTVNPAQVPLEVAVAPKGVDDKTEAAGVPSWGLGPFVRCPENPLIEPRTDTLFFCPIQKMNVPWEGKNIVGAAAAVKDGKVHWLYRAEPINIHHSRVGLAISNDGIHFQRSPTPVIYPDEDAFKQYEWPGGTEDGRIVQREDGLFIYLYCAYDGRHPRQAVAISTDLVHWTKQGLAFARAYDGKYKDITKGGSVVSRYDDDGRVVAEKINGKYWMYCINYDVASSDDCINWTPVVGGDGKLPGC